MKQTLLFALLFFSSFSIFAQSLELKDEEGNVINNQTINVEGSMELIKYKAHVLNKTGAEISVIAKKEYITTIDGSVNTFCWGMSCYPPQTMAGAAVTIPANGTETSFEADYESKENAGISKITYTFYLENNADDKVQLTLNFTPSATFATQDITKENFKAAYPNPAKASTTFEYNNKKNAYISIYNIIGKEIKRIELNNGNGKEIINTSFWKAGTYFYTYFVDNKAVKTHKLLIVK